MSDSADHPSRGLEVIVRPLGRRYWAHVVGIAIEVVILWLMWNGASSAYIGERTAVRKAVTD